MAATSDYLENKILDYVLRAQSYSAPSAIYLSLHSSDPTDDDGGEISAGGNSYARQEITFAAAHATDGSIASNSVETFSDMPAVTVTHIGLHDHVSAGNLLFHGALAANKTVAAGDTVQFASGAITVTLA